jgi:hypothetical protein
MVERIIHEAWSSPLSTSDRITLMTSSLLVNKIFQLTFLSISSKDVHIPHIKYVSHFVQIIAGYSPINDAYSNSPHRRCCSSVTFHVQTQGIGKDNFTDPYGGLLYSLHCTPFLPNLRRVSIEHFDWDFEDILNNGRLIWFPDQVTDLEVTYPPLTQYAMEVLKGKSFDHLKRNWSLPYVKRLTIRGAADGLVKDIARRCLGLEEVVTDADADLDIMTAFPDSVRSLKLEGVDTVRLKGLLDTALSKSLQIKVRSLKPCDTVDL